MIDNKKIALAVDLDGSLIRTDTLMELIVLSIKDNPFLLFFFPFWILKGRAFFKEQISKYAILDVTSLPYNESVLRMIESEKQKGNSIILATATHYTIANAVSEHLGLFDKVIASKDRINLRDNKKRDALVELYGINGYDYIGDSTADYSVWQSANKAILVNPSRSIKKRITSLNQNNQVIDDNESKAKSIIREIRIYQWIKNVLIFIPLFLAHEFYDFEKISIAVYAFLSFSFIASFVYVLNDLLDIPSDRNHQRKKYRPLASGQLKIIEGIALLPILLIAGLGIAIIFLDQRFVLTLISYLLLTSGYSFHFKRLLLVDVLALAALYTIRLIAGAFAVDVVISPWLLAFSMFLFLSLAFIKRFTELKNSTKALPGRGYRIEDIDLIRSIGVTSGYISALVLALYANSQEVVALYKSPIVLWLITICHLFWISRLWFIANRNQMHDDPIIFTFRDKVSYATGTIVLILIILAMI